MAARRSKHVRLYRTAAARRLEEAGFLRGMGDRPLGAVHLAGYAVEFILKALVLALHGEHEQPGLIRRFRGAWAHDYDALRSAYRAGGGAGFPKPVAAAFVVVDEWGTELRYSPRADYPGDIDGFFAAVTTILRWADERL